MERSLRFVAVVCLGLASFGCGTDPETGAGGSTSSPSATGTGTASTGSEGGGGGSSTSHSSSHATVSATSSTGSSGACAHDECVEGAPLASGCSDCVTSVCASDGYCCSGAWDDQCTAEVEQICGINCSGPCTAASCPDGCCNADTGICQTSTCQAYGVTCGGDPLGGGGAGTGTCAFCDSGECDSCDENQCTVCVPDCEGKACGDYDGCGSRCGGACDPGKFCSIALGVCTDQCDASSCPNGCCDASGLCQSGLDDASCGAHGQACAACPSGGPACVLDFAWPPAGGECQPCDSTTCPEGCCSAEGHCETAKADAECGHQGAACVDCTVQGSVCVDYAGSCAECNPDCDGKACGDSDGCGGACNGFCATGTCVVNDSSFVNGCYPCNPTTCTGCCDADGKCVYGGTQHTCGTDGVSCFDCGDQECTADWTVFPPVETCAACGSSCMPPFPPGSDYCQSDGCGGVCPGSVCSGGGTCQIMPGGWAQCSFNPGFCIPSMCNGCCDFSGNCLPGNLPTKCGHDTYCVDCIALGDTCDTATNTCEGCVPDCSGKYCGSGDGCGGVCDAPPAICSDTSVCGPGGVCTCPGADQDLCYDGVSAYHCVDTASNPDHCGNCYSSCPTGTACVDGHCDCGVGSHYCQPSTSGEQGVCTNLADDPEHCGGCLNHCPGTPCNDGVCGSCLPTETACTGACANLDSDDAHCGSCINACPTGITCTGGLCDCGGGLDACGGTCTSLDTDPMNCGSCFHTCPTGVSCSGGSCVCPGSATLCGSTCTNTDVDPANCGGCGHPCAPGHSCSGGTCS